LAIDKHIAPVHGGRLEVQPQMGEGSTFTLSLPARVEGTSIGADPANPFHAFLAQHSSFESCQQDR
jgi:hypothetical protein